MLNRVEWLDGESHTVRLASGWIELGRMKGNIDTPTVEMMPTTESFEARNVRASIRVLSPIKAPSAPMKPSAGNTSSRGWAL